MAQNLDAMQAIALNRFGLGARAGEEAPATPKDWLLAQISGGPIVQPSAQDEQVGRLAADYAQLQVDVAEGDAAAKMEARQAFRKKVQALYREEVGARIRTAISTPTPFLERLVHFWSNHFAISADKPQVTLFAGAFEREAIRPHVLGRFEDMLVAVERHPAMLFYLDQVRSAGPGSRLARQAERRGARRKPGINENLAREIMELHTLGVRTGYTQRDVTQFALALSGWSLGRRGDPDDFGTFMFRQAMHEPGERTIMGKTYAEAGERQARAVLADLAASEATARHVATKLARHFIADDPPPGAVDRLAGVYMSTNGDLSSLYAALLDRPEAWDGRSMKFKNPWDWAISAMRGLGWDGDVPLAPMMSQLGQPVWRPGSPAGYDDIAASWAAPDALVRRLELAQRLVRQAPADVDARDLSARLLAGGGTAMTVQEISRAESNRTALALLLVSPEFQRR